MAAMRDTDVRGVLVGKPANMKGMHSPALGGLAIMSGKRNRGKGKMARPVGFAAGGLASADDSEDDTPEDSSDVGALRAATRRVIASRDGGGEGGGGGGGSAPEDTSPGGLQQLLVQQYREQQRNAPKASDLAAQEDKIAALQEGALNRQLAQSKSMGSGGINIPLLQASAAMLAPTKAGSFGESLGAAGAAGAGALSKQREMDMLQADRESKLQDSVAKVQSDALERKRKTYETSQAAAAKTLETLSNVQTTALNRLKIAQETNTSREMISTLRMQAQAAIQANAQAQRMFTAMYGANSRANMGSANPVSQEEVGQGTAGQLQGLRGAPPQLAPGGRMPAMPGAPGSAPAPAPQMPGPPGATPPMQAPPPAPAPPPTLVPDAGAMPAPQAPDSQLIDERAMQEMENPAPPAPNLPPVAAPPVSTPPIAAAQPPAVSMPMPSAPTGAQGIVPQNRMDQVAMRQQATEAYKLAKTDAARAKDAAIQESQLNTFREAMDRYDSSGRTTAAQGMLKQAIGGALGIEDPGKVSERDLIEKLASQMTMTTASLNAKGVTSNMIERISGQAVPNINTNSLAGNRKIIDYMLKLNDLDKALANTATQWMSVPEPSRRPNYFAAREAVIGDWAKRNAEKKAEGAVPVYKVVGGKLVKQ